MKKIVDWQNHVSRETILKLEKYDQLLHKWQRAVNLVSNSTLDNSWNRHFVDSLQILPLLPKGKIKLMDLGCGAGFSGLVTAICRNDMEVFLVESDSKKCAFMSTVSRETNSPVKLINERIEDIPVQFIDIITARALASLVKLFDYSYKFIGENPNLVFLFHKGEKYQQEIDEARKVYDFDVDIYKSISDSRGCILKVSNVTLCE